ncbi:site-specific integrase [Methylovirgula sp. 4M-Z18]|uniref:site-specific integrase n=1 Tax=Methylovirgula sp. 4M-Z18 TaxID=2293567 RepID=UPI000E2FD8E9|nr:site-specific integrase [Methylovirgula sp. 4M-Z18]RFB76595.1 integrase [Methylovirgula sp. 4M-Z18]
MSPAPRPTGLGRKAAAPGGAASPPLTDVQYKRACELDALAAVVSWDTRDKLATLLSDDDIATLRHLVETGMGANTLRALTSDLGYLEAWCVAATGTPLPWPAPESLVLKFVAHHLWDPAKRETDRTHGMPAEVAATLTAQKLLRGATPRAVSTVERRLASWSTLHQWRGLESPISTPTVRKAFGFARRASNRPRIRKSKTAVTRKILNRLTATCHGARLTDARDLAVLLLAFASGGRRRSEVAGLRVEQLVKQPPVPVDPRKPELGTLPCLGIRLGRTKNTTASDDATVYLVGPPVVALRDWLARARIAKGAVFRRIDRWQVIGERALTPEAVNLIVKKRCRAAGLHAEEFSAHGLRAGYLTEAARRGIPLPEAMRQSQHRSVQQAASYYNDAEAALGRAARLGL